MTLELRLGLTAFAREIIELRQASEQADKTTCIACGGVGKHTDTCARVRWGIEQVEKTKPFEIEWPDYHWQAMGAGLEDMGITDRYDAMKYGWEQALEHVAESLPKKLYTHPPKPQVQPLPVMTQAQMDVMWKTCPYFGPSPGRRAWIAAYEDSHGFARSHPL